ncbi:conserved hypothetical protein [Clostridium neonatale]|uniref:hypothetical protein n=1 Tax=Clostridium neonatale TaxID=137838 RepID=UPI00291C08B1|nr:hypothetical protein [Clostridium neonatale]CAI3207803.1 conserved hypothetical protein [Clostridium neonatale]CAI3226752.1 conserved hypothetical protein [Clostridium neonatale]
MSKDLETGHYVGTVKQDCSEDAKAFAGIELLVFYIKDDKEAVILGGLTLEDTEKFFKASYENGGKEYIADDYEYCVWLLADEDCEVVPHIKLSDLENLREATQEDADKFDKSFNEFKKVHKFAEREQAMKEQEEKEKIAVEEFKKLDKVDVEVRLGEKSNKAVKAVIYKGFAIHDYVAYFDTQNEPMKAITVIEGEGKGMKLLDCNVTEYKKCIDEIRAVIGDKILERSDLPSIKSILKKY